MTHYLCNKKKAPQDVIPAKAGIHEILKRAAKWIPASAGMTSILVGMTPIHRGTPTSMANSFKTGAYL